jgi:hypothetical protein
MIGSGATCGVEIIWIRAIVAVCIGIGIVGGKGVWGWVGGWGELIELGIGHWGWGKLAGGNKVVKYKL